MLLKLCPVRDLSTSSPSSTPGTPRPPAVFTHLQLQNQEKTWNSTPLQALKHRLMFQLFLGLPFPFASAGRTVRPGGKKARSKRADRGR